MSLTRQTQKVFGSNADADQLAVFGSMKTGTPVYSTNLATLQSTAYTEGWSEALLNDKAPYMEEMNAVQYGLSYQIAYMLQEGAYAYDANTTYSNTSIVKVVDSNGVSIYRSLIDDNLGHSISDPDYWQLVPIVNANNYVLSVLQTIYPVGAIYLGTTSTCPMSALFGTWELVAQDKVLQGASTSHLPNTTISAGLPNITGQINDSYSWPGIGSASGAFSFGSTSSNILRAGDGGTIAAENHYTFDASNSSSVYGSSTTVQPPAYVVNVWRRTA